MPCNVLTYRTEGGDTKFHGFPHFCFMFCPRLHRVDAVPGFGQSSKLGSLHSQAGVMLKLVAGASQSRVKVALP